MQWLILGVGLMVGTILLVQGFATADPKKLARFIRWLLAGVGAVAVVWLVVTGRLGLIFWTLPLLLPLLMRWRAVLNQVKAAAGPTPGQSSSVETAALRMWLDHDTGAMDGEVRTGPFQGRTLSSLSEAELMDLLARLHGADPQSAALVEAFLDRSFPDWRADAGHAGDDRSTGAGQSSRPPSGGGMTVEEALEVLGLGPDPGVEEIKEAHRRLMLKNHPDQGGSTYIAAKINQAKDLLLGRHKTRT